MAENSSRQQSSDQSSRPGPGDQSPGAGQEQPASAGRRSSTPGVFADGSTKAQQDAILREKKETDQLVKAAGDAERKARG